MATFLPNVTDQVGSQELYTPDFSFLTKVMGVKQAEYDRGFNYVKNIYNSALNRELTNPHNLSRRDEIIKKIQDQIKSVAYADLANPLNIQKAESFMDPIVKDREIIRDMFITQKNNDVINKMEQFKYSLDPNTRSLYNQYSVADANMSLQNLRGAKRGDGSILNIQPGEFIPYENPMEFLNKIAKEQGVEIEITKAGNDGYIYSVKNGTGAYEPFTKWAAAQMGDRFDRQFAQQARVQVNSSIEQQVQSGLSREQALQNMTSATMQTMIRDNVNRGLYSDDKIKEFDARLAVYKRKYSGKNSMPKNVYENFMNIVNEKEHYIKELADAQAQAALLQEEGESYVMKNMNSYYANQLKLAKAQEWAVTKADASYKLDVKHDQVWLEKFQQANLNRRFDIEHNLKERKFQYEQFKDQRDYELEFAKAKADGKIAFDEYVGSMTPSENLQSVDILYDSYQANYDQLFTNVFSPTDGILTKITTADNANRFYNAVAALKEGRKLDQTQMVALEELANSVGTTLNVNESAAQNINNIIAGIYQKGVKAMTENQRAGNSAQSVDDAKKFQSVLGNIRSLLQRSGEILDSNYQVYRTITTPNGGLARGFENAKIKGYDASGTPIFDLSAVPKEIKQGLDNVVATQFSSKTLPIGQVWEHKNVTTAEYQQIANNSTMILDDEGKSVKGFTAFNLPAKTIEDIFGKNIIASYDPVTKTAMYKITADVKNPKVVQAAGLKPGKTYTFHVPYEVLKNERGLQRMSKFSNAVDIKPIEVTGMLTELLENPNTIVSANSFISATGFDYNMVYDKTKGAFNIAYSVSKPYSNDVMKNRHSIMGGLNTQTLMNVEDYLNEMYIKYISALSSADKLPGEEVPVNVNVTAR
jgi:hypothetical protein